MAFALSDLPKPVNTLRAILERPFYDFSVLDIRKAYRDTILTGDKQGLGTLLFTWEMSQSVKKQLAPERYGNHEALISREKFEMVTNSLKEAKNKKK